VVEGRRPSELIEHLQVLFQGVGDIVEELVLVHGAVGATFRAGAVVGDEHDQGVVPLTDRLEELEEPAVLLVGVGEEAANTSIMRA
jgi:hypothetical protein